MLSKLEIDFAVSIVRKGVRKKKKSVTAERFSEKWNVGRLMTQSNQYVYGLDDLTILTNLLSRAGLDTKRELVLGGSRTETAKYIVKEKTGAAAVFPAPVCMKVVEQGVLINGNPVLKTGRGHLQFSLQDIDDIQASAIVLVENLDAFRLLEHVIIEGNTLGLLFIWRGGPFSNLSMPNTGKVVKELSQKFDIPIGVFADYDLKGLIIAQEMTPKFVILPRLEDLAGIKGSEEDFSTQWHEYATKQSNVRAMEPIIPYIDYLLARKESFTQERMNALKVTHEFFRAIKSDQ